LHGAQRSHAGRCRNARLSATFGCERGSRRRRLHVRSITVCVLRAWALPRQGPGARALARVVPHAARGARARAGRARRGPARAAGARAPALQHIAFRGPGRWCAPALLRPPGLWEGAAMSQACCRHSSSCGLLRGVSYVSWLLHASDLPSARASAVVCAPAALRAQPACRAAPDKLPGGPWLSPAHIHNPRRAPARRARRRGRGRRGRACGRIGGRARGGGGGGGRRAQGGRGCRG